MLRMIVKTNDHLLVSLEIYGALLKQQLKLTNDFVINFDLRTAGTNFYSNSIASVDNENPEIIEFMGLTDDAYDLKNIFTEELIQYNYRAMLVSLYSLFEASLLEVEASLGVKTTSTLVNKQPKKSNKICIKKPSQVAKSHNGIKQKFALSVDFSDLDESFKEIDDNLRRIRNNFTHGNGTFNLKPGNDESKIKNVVKDINKEREFIKLQKHHCKICSHSEIEPDNCPNCRYGIVMLDGFIEHSLQLMMRYAKMLNVHLNNKTNVRYNN